MTKKSRLITVAMVMLSLFTVLIGSPKPVRAYLGSSFDSMVESMLSAMNNTMDDMMTTMLTLSNDVGTMSDRILVMADNIGIMADRIVTTEELLADLVRDITDSKGPSALIISPAEGAVVDLSLPMDITLSTGADDYVLFMSNTADMAAATNILVQDGDTGPATNRALDYATGNQLYIAVKAIDGDTMGPISNTVMINI